MAETLVADIGGTNSRFALRGKTPADLKQVTIFKNEEHDSFEAIYRQALAHFGLAVSTATIAVAGPLTNGEIVLTNRGWIINGNALSKLCGNIPTRLVNDFEALALSLPHLMGEDLRVLTREEPSGSGHRLVLGPGTGLGVGFLLEVDGHRSAAPGEGGHITLPVNTEREISVLRQLRKMFGRVSAERVLSGPGLVSLYNALRMASDLRSEQVEPREILNRFSKQDEHAMEALQLFCIFLGRVAGDLSLALVPKGGVYIGGDLIRAIFKLVDEELFLTELRNKGRVSGAINTIPVCTIEHQYPGLVGAAAAANG